MTQLLLLTVIVFTLTMIALCDTTTLCDVLSLIDYSSCCIVSMQLAAVPLSVKKQKPTELTQHQVDAVVGMAHSDVHIERRPNGSRLKICQGHAQMDLVYHL